MEAIREIKKLKGHKVTIDLPEEFSGLEIEVIVLPLVSKSSSRKESFESLFLSESALKKDWNKPSEDKAWENL